MDTKIGWKHCQRIFKEIQDYYAPLFEKVTISNRVPLRAKVCYGLSNEITTSFFMPKEKLIVMTNGYLRSIENIETLYVTIAHEMGHSTHGPAYNRNAQLACEKIADSWSKKIIYDFSLNPLACIEIFIKELKYKYDLGDEHSEYSTHPCDSYRAAYLLNKELTWDDLDQYRCNTGEINGA